MKQKLISLAAKIFTIGTIAMLVLGILTALLYVVAFLFGGALAESIVAFVNGRVFPVMFVLNILFCVSGIVHTYLIGNRGFRFDIGKK